MDSGSILYIGGCGHSGSTVFDIVLGDAPKIVSGAQIAGLAHIADFRAIECACGEVLSACSLWGTALAQLSPEQYNAIRATENVISNERGFAQFLLSRNARRRYAEAYDPLISALLEAGNAEVIVDSSKNLSRALALLTESRFDVRFLHLVRDSRAYVRSVNRRRRARGEQSIYSKPLGKWAIKNFVASTVIRAIASGRYMKVSFEEWLLEPVATLSRIEKFISKDLSEVIRRIESGGSFEPKHIFSGGRVSRRGAVRIEPERLIDSSIGKEFPLPARIVSGGLSGLWGCRPHFAPEEARPKDDTG